MIISIPDELSVGEYGFLHSLFKKKIINIQRLIKNGYVVFEGNSYRLSKKGEKLFEISEDWIKEWCNLWKGIKTPGINGYLCKPDLKTASSRFNTYFKSYKTHSVEQIFDATKRYLEEKKMVNYSYCKKGVKFIFDNDGSELANLVEELFYNEKEISKFGKDL